MDEIETPVEETEPVKKKRGRPKKVVEPEEKLYIVTHKSRIFTSKGAFRHGEKIMLGQADADNHKGRVELCGS